MTIVTSSHIAHSSCETQCKAARLSYDMVSAVLFVSMVPVHSCLKDKGMWVDFRGRWRPRALQWCARSTRCIRVNQYTHLHWGWPAVDEPFFVNVQLAGQSVEAFMDRRGFRALPEYEQVWAVPVSEVPAAYNLRAHLADLTEQEDEDSISQSTADRHASRTPADRPFRAKQKVVKVERVTTTPTESPLNVNMCLSNLCQITGSNRRLAHPFLSF